MKVLERSDFRNGCPIASVTLDVASVSEELRTACADAFSSWLETISAALRKVGAPASEAAAPEPSYFNARIRSCTALAR